ncbi:MAG: YqiJ family protein [Myxococcota bacterium]|nr:YqiJ family protein [Myxococcota bacterium]
MALDVRESLIDQLAVDVRRDLHVLVVRVRADAQPHDFRQAENVEAVDEQRVGDSEEELFESRRVESGHEQPYVPQPVGRLQALLFPDSDALACPICPSNPSGWIYRKERLAEDVVPKPELQLGASNREGRRLVMELIEASLRFPVVVFTIGLGIVLIYWLFVLLGALDIDLLGGADHHGHDAAGHDADGVLSKLGLGVVPVTITVSLIMLVGWVGSLLAMHHGGHITWVKYAVLPGMLVGGMLVTSVLVRPIAPVFKIREGKSNREYVGHTCTVTTATVDENFGHANVEDGGVTMDIAVRCDGTAKLVRNEKALIIEFDEERQAYLVEPVSNILPTSKSGDAS